MTAGNLLVVCLMDVLGFHDILEKSGLHAVERKYKTLIAFVAEQTGGLSIAPMPDGHVGVGWLQIGNVYFSDTILFWTRYDPIRLQGFTQMVSEAVCFGLETGLPLRGALAVGELILDKERGTFLGKPLVEASRVERLQNWIGVSFGPSFRAPTYSKGFYLHTVLPFKSHYKKPDDELATGMTVDWPRKWRETRKTDARAKLQELDRSPQYSHYYRNTIRFVDFSEENHDWFRHREHLDYG